MFPGGGSLAYRRFARSSEWTPPGSFFCGELTMRSSINNILFYCQACLLVPHGCAPDESDLFVIGGQPNSDYPAVVLIASSTGQCTGTFVSETTLVTAAHC